MKNFVQSLSKLKLSQSEIAASLLLPVLVTDRRDSQIDEKYLAIINRYKYNHVILIKSLFF